MTMQSTIGSKPTLQGDWRRRRGTKTDAHLYAGGTARRPRCGKVIERYATEAVEKGRPCTDCLVAAIRAEAGR